MPTTSSHISDQYPNSRSGKQSEYQVTCDPLDDPSALKKVWQQLEVLAAPRFFLSWHWIGTWLETYQPKVSVISVRHIDQIVGLGILGAKSEVRFKLIHSRNILLHQLGDMAQDQIWIEYNDFLAHPDHVSAVSQHALHYLNTQCSGWDELTIGAITEETADRLCHHLPLVKHTLWEAPCYGVDLAQLRERNQSFLDSLSRNTRYQIRHSQRQYDAQGNTHVEIASSVDEALKYLDEIGPLHIARWGDEPGESGFANPAFVEFHQNIIRNAWPGGSVELIRITVDNTPIAYFYNFIYGKRVYFYLSGLVFDNNPKMKPGLLGHALCIQRYIDQGLDYYDFMGGGERYKASLGQQHDQLTRIRLQKHRIKFTLEHLARNIKQAISPKSRL